MCYDCGNKRTVDVIVAVVRETDRSFHLVLSAFDVMFLIEHI